MERGDDNAHHVIDIGEASNSHQNETENPSSSTTSTVSQPSSSTTTARNTTPANGTDGRRWDPLNSGYWISFKFVVTLSEILAAVVVLSKSRHEHPHAPLFTWVICYASGCVATLPILVYRFYHRNEQDQDSAPNSVSATELKAAVEYFSNGLDWFFIIWVIIGEVWVFFRHSSASDAPKLHRLCLVFLAYRCIAYAIPFILYATVCCCLPILGPREDLSQNRGATIESINSLPTYKFKIKKHNMHGSNRGGPHESSSEGGVVAAGTENERVLSGEDAVCCICLAKYGDNDELMRLMCSHFFHKDCADKWLKIDASCPLCKSEVGERVL